MFRVAPFRIAFLSLMVAALAVAAGGCGEQSESSLPPLLENPDEVAAVLPKGVTYDSPVVPDKRYGESSKTVKDALASLRARVKDGVLVSGYTGPPIRFDNEPAAKSKPAGSSRTSKKVQKPPAVIHLAH
jgi:hypothetical protein